MDGPNITKEEYIRLEEEKAHRRGQVYNWETTKYGKIWYDEDVHNLGSFGTEFPAIVINDTLTSDEALSCKPTVSPLNDNEIDFRISFDESDDEDYTVIYDENSFSYKIISVNNLKTDSENDNDKVNIPSFPSLEPELKWKQGGDQGACKLLGCLLGDVIEVLGVALLEVLGLLAWGVINGRQIGSKWFTGLVFLSG
ncbi:hypothetical protein Tco_0744690 [Tanacetum coccineum]